MPYALWQFNTNVASRNLLAAQNTRQQIKIGHHSLNNYELE